MTNENQKTEEQQFIDEALNKMTKAVKNPTEENLQEADLNADEFEKLMTFTWQEIMVNGDQNGIKEKIAPLLSVLDESNSLNKNNVKIGFLKSFFDPSIKSRKPSNSQIKRMVCNALKETAYDDETISKIDKSTINCLSEEKSTKHKSSVTKYDKYPEKVKEIYLTADSDLETLEIMKRFKQIDKESYDIIKKDILLSRDSDVCVATIQSHAEDKHVEKLVLKLKELTEGVDAIELYTQMYGKLFENSLVSCDNNKQICEKLDEFVLKIEQSSGTTFASNDNRVFKIKREVEKQIEEAFANDKKDRECFVKGKKLEKETLEFRREEKTAEVFAKFCDPFSEEDFKGSDWNNIEKMLVSKNELLKSCKKQFEELDKQYRQAKREYAEVNQKIKTYFDPKNNDSKIAPLSIQAL